MLDLPARIASFAQLAFMFVVLLTVKVVGRVVTSFYRIFPFPGLLDTLYSRIRPIKAIFSFHLSTDPVRAVATAPELIRMAGFPVQSHSTITDDGFVLTLHRIPHGGGDPDSGGNTQQAACQESVHRPPVLVVHGLMMCSDAWVAGPPSGSLAFTLANAGFDVWLANNRGNRYSCKHVRLSPQCDEFWDWSLDELARYDIPCMINYIMNATGYDKVSIVGFSQGSAQTFAALSSQPWLQQHVSSFVALSPAVTVTGLSRSLIHSLVTANMHSLHTLFGRRCMLPSTLVWQRIFTPWVFNQVIDASMAYLFSWDTSEIDPAAKEDLYAHIYSFSSVKAVVHWFQMINSSRFQMYSDSTHQYAVPVQYDVSTIRTPVSLFYGGKDTIIAPDRLLQLLSHNVFVHFQPTYEHLDFMWGATAPQQVFPHVVQQLWRHVPTQLASK